MKLDSVLAGILFAGVSWCLLKRNLGHIIPWVVLVYFVGSRGANLSCTLSMLLAIVSLHVIALVTQREYFENEEKEEEEEAPKKKDPEAAPAKTDSPHVDVGTTILHAYRNLTPEQIGGMRRDTKELMSLQKELMGSLSEMKPAIEQGAELLKTFGTFFGKPETGELPPQ
jgi:hypothetical protein